MPEQRAIDRAFFRERNDGSTVFFPWGLTHRGYRLTSDTAKKKATRAASFLVSSSIAVGTWVGYVLSSMVESEAAGLSEIVRALLAPAAALTLVLLSYAVWASRFVERFPESDLRVSREERLREAAELAGPWKVALIGAVVCVLSALLIWLPSRARWLGVLGFLLGCVLLRWSSLLRRAAAEEFE